MCTYEYVRVPMRQSPAEKSFAHSLMSMIFGLPCIDIHHVTPATWNAWRPPYQKYGNHAHVLSSAKQNMVPFPQKKKHNMGGAMRVLPRINKPHCKKAPGHIFGCGTRPFAKRARRLLPAAPSGVLLAQGCIFGHFGGPIHAQQSTRMEIHGDPSMRGAGEWNICEKCCKTVAKACVYCGVLRTLPHTNHAVLLEPKKHCKRHSADSQTVIRA